MVPFDLSGVILSKFQSGGGAKLEQIFPNQVNMTVKKEKWAIQYHKSNNILKKTGLFL